MSVADYSTNPALNTQIAGIDIGEGSAAAGYNNALRQIMADIRAWTDAYAVTYPIEIDKGGTGEITAPAALAALGGLPVAYRELPQDPKSAAFSFALSQTAGHIYYTGGAAAATIEPNGTVAFPLGTVLTVINNGSGVLTLTRGAGVAMKWAATGADANRALAVGGMATLIKVGTDLWWITGAQLS